MTPLTSRMVGYGALVVVLAQVGAAPAPEPKVTIAAAGDRLLELIPVLGKGAGVPYRCGPKVADRRLILLTSEQPLSTVRTQLAQFIPLKPGKAHWFKNGSTLEFDEDLASYNARLQLARETIAESEKRRRRQLDSIQKWAQPNQRDTPPAAVGREVFSRYLDIFKGLPVAQQQAALKGRPIEVPYASLSPSAQALVFQQVRGAGYTTESRPDLTFNGARDYAKTVVQAWPAGTPERPGLHLRIQYPKGGGKGIDDLLNAPEWDREGGWDWSEHGESYTKRQRGPKDANKISELQKLITLVDPKRIFFESVLAELSRQSELPLIGEYDPCYATPYSNRRIFRIQLDPKSVQKVPTWKALEILCTRFDLEWDFRDGWIWIRSPRTVASWNGLVDLSPPKPEAE